MTTLQMRYFVAVCDNMGFSKAAEALYISQPAISKHIAALEKEVGLKLISRSKGEFSLTGAGEYYLNAFRESLSSIDRAALRAQYIDSSKKLRYRIGLVENWMLHKMVRRCRDDMASAMPDVQLDFDFLPHKQLNTLRADGTLDFVLTISGAFSKNRSYTAVPLASIHPTLLVSAEHPLANKPDLSIADLRDEPYFILPDSEIYTVRYHDLMLHLDGSVPRWTDIPNLSTIAKNVMAGYGYAFFDEWSEETHSDLFYARTSSDVTLTVVASWKRGYREDIAERVFESMRSWASEPVF